MKKLIRAKILAWLGIIIFCILACDAGPQIKWTKFDEEYLNQAQHSGKPTLAYFYAAWCGPCQQLSASTFRDIQVVTALEAWNRFKADMSFRENTLTISRTRKFEVWGLPTLIFYDSTGKQVEKLTGFVSAQSLIETIRAVEAKTANAS